MVAGGMEPTWKLTVSDSRGGAGNCANHSVVSPESNPPVNRVQRQRPSVSRRIRYFFLSLSSTSVAPAMDPPFFTSSFSSPRQLAAVHPFPVLLVTSPSTVRNPPSSRTALVTFRTIPPSPFTSARGPLCSEASPASPPDCDWRAEGDFVEGGSVSSPPPAQPATPITAADTSAAEGSKLQRFTSISASLTMRTTPTRPGAQGRVPTDREDRIHPGPPLPDPRSPHPGTGMKLARPAPHQDQYRIAERQQPAP